MKSWRKLRNQPTLTDRFALAYMSALFSAIIFVVIWTPLLATSLANYSWMYPFPLKIFLLFVFGAAILGFTTLDKYIVGIFAILGDFIYRKLWRSVIDHFDFDS